MKWCPNCKTNIMPLLMSHPTLKLATLTCPVCESTNLEEKHAS